MNNEFYAIISRMKYIDRWALMRNTEAENLMQHSYEVAVLAHALCVLGNTRCGMALDAEKAAVIALYHDASEILTGDMPTPVKYYSEEIRDAYKHVEAVATDRLLDMLPADLQPSYTAVLAPEDDELKKVVKAADKLSALIKCIEEAKAGNREFDKAYESTLNAIHALDFPPAECFLEEFLEPYNLTLDQLR
ncbi:MAG: 5'-deoxynucleotidase [Clostridia bacterium]|nr:5'-deoxynucleotidase [Clostridia bacterium]